jgi:transposase
MLPHAYVSPAERRATRDLLRRRLPLRRKRAELRTYIQHTKSQYTLPEMGKNIAYQANHPGGVERFPAPAVQKSMAVDLALIDHDDHLLREMELTILKTAKQHVANTLGLLRTVSAVGAPLSLVLRDEIQDLQRFPRVQAFVSSCRLVTCTKTSAGRRDGTAGTKLGDA